MARTNASMLTNLEAASKMLGAVMGMEDGLEKDEYLEGVIRQAHGEASRAFDLATAATAKAGYLSHMYEFGTSGITPGQVKFPDPTAEAARLWSHQIKGQGGNMSIGYGFRPAFNRNPQPTTKSTGVSSKYLRKLSKRKYVFWNKALVMESGMEVTIPGSGGMNNGKYLFVPFYARMSRKEKNNRGFMMYNTETNRPIVTRPGKKSAGQFTKWWNSWWNTAGRDVIERDVTKSVEMDIIRAQAVAAKEAGKSQMKPVEATDLIRASQIGKKLTLEVLGKKRRVR